ncbi:hypothetical protein WN943_013115 [Citrus x changshan-huyou]
MLKNEEKSMFLDVDEAPDLRLGAYKSAATWLLCYANGQFRVSGQLLLYQGTDTILKSLHVPTARCHAVDTAEWSQKDGGTIREQENYSCTSKG